MNKFLRYSTLVLAASSLGACQSFPLTSWAFGGDKDRSNSPEKLAAVSGAQTLEEGRELLRSGNISAAVAAFRVASLDESVRADANNGLAVAYAKLGRADLAERYFRTAIMMEPDNMKFSANLLRLQKEVMFARASAAPAEPVVAAAEPETPATVIAKAEPKAERPLVRSTARVQRVARGAVHITSNPSAAAAPNMVVAYREKPAEEAEADTSTEEPAAKPDKVASLAPKPRSYPVRVSFN